MKITAYILIITVIFFILMPNTFWWKYLSADIFLVNIIVVVFLLATFKKLWVGLTFLLPLLAIVPFELFYINTYGRPSDAHIFGVLAETNVTESGEFLIGVNPWLILGLLTPILVVIFIIKKSFKENWLWNNKQRRLTLILGWLVAGIFILPETLSESVAGLPVNNDSLIMGNQETSLASASLENSYPIGIPFRINSFINQSRGLKQAQAIVNDFKFNATQNPVMAGRQIHVLVIGETGRPDHWQLNGYTRPTNPQLSNIPDVISLTNVISGWAWTRMAVPIMITRKPASTTTAFFNEKSLVSAYREAGFKTYWLSTQGPLGVHESSIALHAHEAHETKFLNKVDYRGSGAHDGVLLQPLQDILEKNELKQLIVLHTLGGHYNYADRHPPEFNVFTPSLTGFNGANMYDRTQKTLMVNSYDNSIVYTDYFLAEVIQRLKATRSPATLLYSADHGENLFDNECDKSGHGHGTEYDFRVASLWWNSAEYADLQPEKVAYIRTRQDMPLTTEHTFYTMLDAANIEYPVKDKRKSILSSTWLSHPRWTQGDMMSLGLDFDTSPRDAVCKQLLPPSGRTTVQ
ncbi:MAG: sulfatase-like hydrolase/transferase [Candidatus Thiothrix putei]|uniref:Phosphoethanolamine transferase for glucans (OPG), alkaline phosphatase superfamily n=2 Tax=Thiothrix TaxID=1030 RepID=A0A1H4BH00_9GAMM|nr:phosphoethanolamine transferase [Thiothrix caldifontis]WGZ95328.1 MAG: sulfatase-like hydrolase/transferase [Candidatus Thiothrix putei]SEA47377.1 Phosphoethanolamine transferase for glucans (OPG), alkaline phosphatase superfamily [Thiothrix caldifontis]